MSENIVKPFYITTTLPYVNADPHIGFAAEIIRADVLSRYHRALGEEVFFNTGTDEHGLKIYRKALENSLSPKEYCDQFAAVFDKLKDTLNLSYNNFIRTTDEHHLFAAQEFWRRCLANGDIYKKNYQVKYCVGCELEKTDSELIDGHCPLHPGQEIELIDEENYFFRFSKYQQALIDFYEKNPGFVVPSHRQNEIMEFVKRGLEDFSISRLASKMPWGVPVPGDADHVMYVWFDALVNYISALGWPKNDLNFKKFWPGMQVAGKDNLRQQTSMWQAMLMSAGLPNTRQVLIFGFITANGQKMSKSLGNVVSPFELVEKFGTDAVRYFLLSEITPFEDGDFSHEKMNARYTADLANGLGNLLSRILTLLEKNSIILELPEETDHVFADNVDKKMQIYRFDEALKIIWDELRKCDEILSREKPWKMTNKNDIQDCLLPLARILRDAARLFTPMLPQTAEKVLDSLHNGEVVKGSPLFPRL